MKKLISLVLALAMIMMVAAASAATITITPPTGTSADAENTYTIYKIFDAIVNPDHPEIVNYTLPEGIDTPPTGFSVDTAGNVSYTGSSTNDELTAGDIDAIKAYITANSISGTDVTVTGTTPAEFGNLPAGYYFIATTTGTLVTVKTNNETVNVVDKNTVPTLEKEITDASGSITNNGTLDDAGNAALAQIGTDVEFTVTINVGKGMKDYKLHDHMSSGLSLNASSVQVNYSATPTGYAGATIKTGDEADQGDDLTVEFADGLAEGTVITVTYTAKVTNEALTVDPENNTADVEFANGPTTSHTPPVSTDTHSAKIGVNKMDGSNNNAPLAGAGFKLYKFDTDGTTKLYYTYNASSKTVSWGSSTTDERITKADGSIDPFLGLNDGTYYLEESTVPAGYNAPASDTEITITGTDYTANNLEQVADVTNNQGAVLPSTGGIGTTIFYIVGGLLLVGAAIVLVARRKAEN